VYPFEHLHLPCTEDFQPPLCFDVDEGKDMVCPGHNLHDDTLQPSFVPSSHYITKEAVVKHVPFLKFSPGDLGGYRWPPTFSNWLKTTFWQF
jgi:hypothetical protein